MAKLMGQNYPNPADHFTTIPMGEIRKDMTVVVSDLQGRVLMNIPLSTGMTQLRVDTSGIPSGTYTCRLLDRNTVIDSRKVVVLH
jgi:hypothetical protein